MRKQVYISIATVILCLIAAPLNAQQQNSPNKVEQTPVRHCEGEQVTTTGCAEEKAELAGRLIPDVKVVDQNGKSRRFYSDLIKGKVVAINFVYTSCKGICPSLSANFSRLQRLMGDRLGKDFYLISISLEPGFDLPERLSVMAKQFGAKDGWSFVTGEEQEVDKLLTPFIGGLLKVKEMHSPSIVIINDDKGVLEETYGLTGPDELLKLMDDISRIKTRNMPEEYSRWPISRESGQMK